MNTHSSNTYVIYTRRSTDDPINQKNSIEYQTTVCRRLASELRLPVAPETHPGFCTSGVIQERHTAFKTPPLDILRDGTVRYTIERPKFQRLVGALASGMYRGVICLCWDRLSRNPHDDAVIKDLLRRGVDVRFVQTIYEATSAGALHMDIDGMFAAHSSRQSSEKIRAANAKMRAEGKCTNRSPMGYLDKGPDHKPLDPERAPLIRRLFQLYSSGEWSYIELGRWAREHGLTTKPHRGKRTPEEIADGDRNVRAPASRPVNDKAIELILQNPFYAGFIVHGGDRVRGLHEPIVSPALFQKVQATIRRRTTTVRFMDKEFYIYRRMVRCTCGRAYSPYEKKGFTYYRVHCLPDCPSADVNLREEVLDDFVAGFLGSVAFRDDELDEINAQAPHALSERVRTHAARQEEHDRKRLKLERDRAYLLDNKLTLLREGVYTAEAFRNELAGVEEQIDAIGTTIAPADLDLEQQKLASVLSFSELAKMAQTTYKSADETEKHEIAVKAIRELVVKDRILANVRAKEGFRELANRHVVGYGGPSYVFRELDSICAAIRITTWLSPESAD